MSAAAALAAVQVVGTLYSGYEERQAARSEARVLDENARLSILAGEQDIATTRREERRLSGETIAALAGSGGTVGTGSALDLIRQNAIEREVEVGNIRAQARQQADDYRTAARDRRKAGDAALIRSVFGSAGTVLGAVVDGGSQRKLDKQADKERASRLPRRTTFGTVGLPGR